VLPLFGGIRYKYSESPWANSWAGLVHWGTNEDGELLVDVTGLGTTYILNWGASAGLPFAQRPGHISLFEWDGGAYRLLDPNKPSNQTQMGAWDLLGPSSRPISVLIRGS
jgi:hypothetical protein